MKTLKEAVEEVNRIGEPDEIAKFLKEENVRGYAANGCGCPLAMYLARKTGKVVRVTYATISTNEFDPSTGLIREAVITPLNLCDFIRMTDRFQYPFLIAGYEGIDDISG